MIIFLDISFEGAFYMPLTESNLLLQSISCDKTGYDAFCVICPECECCDKVTRKTIPFNIPGGRGELITHGNSAIISLKLTFNDVVEEFIFERIRVELTRNPGSLIKPIREPEEGFHISFFLEEGMVRERNQRQSLLKYLEIFPDAMRQVLSRGKMTINNFVRKQAKELRV